MLSDDTNSYLLIIKYIFIKFLYNLLLSLLFEQIFPVNNVFYAMTNCHSFNSSSICTECKNNAFLDS